MKRKEIPTVEQVRENIKRKEKELREYLRDRLIESLESGYLISYGWNVEYTVPEILNPVVEEFSLKGLDVKFSKDVGMSFRFIVGVK